MYFHFLQYMYMTMYFSKINRAITLDGIDLPYIGRTPLFENFLILILKSMIEI